MTPLRTCTRFTFIVAAFAAGTLIAAVPHRAPAEDSTQTQDGAQATTQRCLASLWDAPHPPVNFTPVLLRVLQPSIEPVPATDELVHLAYVAQVTNTQRQPADILDVVAVDPLADFVPTGRNIELDAESHDVTAKVRRFTLLPHELDDPQVEPMPDFFTRVPAESGGLMFFDVTYTDLARVPRLLAHAITVASPVGTPAVLALTNPVPVGCVPLAVVHPPLVGHGWTAFEGCCTFALYHRDAVLALNGDLLTSQHFAIDYEQLGPNNSCCNGPPAALSSWWGYGAPVLAVTSGVVADIMDGMPDQQPVGTVTPLPFQAWAGNFVIEDIGDGRFVEYGHLKPGTIPAPVRKGAVLKPGDLIGRVGSSGNSSGPHLHFQLMDRPSPLDATGLPFVFDTQLLEGRVSEGVIKKFEAGAAVTVDRTGAGLKRNLMPARNHVFGYNLSP